MASGSKDKQSGTRVDDGQGQSDGPSLIGSSPEVPNSLSESPMALAVSSNQNYSPLPLTSRTTETQSISGASVLNPFNLISHGVEPTNTNSNPLLQNHMPLNPPPSKLVALQQQVKKPDGTPKNYWKASETLKIQCKWHFLGHHHSVAKGILQHTSWRIIMCQEQQSSMGMMSHPHQFHTNFMRLKPF
ncbi:hypothetical protein Acr_12g0005750 [Actinidia rufa]|uniref:Uncharacterized protein n=1 Tax=Actinidia rufa TaxID=165716 RepID=A0A7J0FH59_9ERIC|nr:hypothetical protein Acr_12g0005750 [Actinidia rufa]